MKAGDPRRLLSLALALVLCSAVAWFQRRLPLLPVSLDLLSWLEPPDGRPLQTAVLILGVDLEVLRAYGLPALPGAPPPDPRLLDRQVFVDALRKLARHAPSVIGVDFLFSSARDPKTDEALAAAIRDCGNVVIAGAWTADLVGSRLVWQPPLPSLEGAARDVGFVNVPVESDGVVRRVPLRTIPEAVSGGERTPLALAVARLALRTQNVAWASGGVTLQNARPFPDRFVPTDANGSAWLRIPRGPEGTPPFPTLPLMRFLRLQDAATLDALVKDKVVLIGTTDALFGDLHRTPELRFASAGPLRPGVEVIAATVHNLLEGRWLEPQPAWLMAVAVLLLTWSNVLLFFRLGMLGWLWALPLEALLLAAGSYALYERGALVSLGDLLASTSVAAAVGGAWRSAFDRVQRARLSRTLSHYLSDAVAREVLQKPHLLQLGGEKRELTILFSDIRGFTTLSERLPPDRLVAILNEYLGRMTDIILASDGVLDKYIGDAIMAFWGAPAPAADHAMRACGVAVDMLETLEKLGPSWVAKGNPPLAIGVGINTGPVVVGNMGSTRRFDYTVMGDAVNLASRLEGLNKEYGTRVLVGPDTARAARSGYVLRRLDRVRVKGKQQGVDIYELQGRIGRVAPEREKANLLYEASLEDYFRRDWLRAEQGMTRVLELVPADPAAELMLRRMRALSLHPPGDDWDGVYVMETK